MINEIECNWIKDLAFEAEIDGHKIILDTEAGNRGPRPKPLLLLALAGCTGMDVISILCKMKVEVGSFRLKVSGDTTETHPKYYKTMHIQYIFKGKDLDREKLKKAIELSQDSYCCVIAQFKMGIPVTYEIIME